MEYQIGQEIELQGRHKIKLVVTEHTNCDGCFFIHKCKMVNRAFVRDMYGECSCLERKDGKNIIFKVISDNDTDICDTCVEQNVNSIYQASDNYIKGQNVYFTSDLHLCHDREFIFGPRGFKTVEDMNYAIEKNWNDTVQENDTVYVLGDLMLGGSSNKGIDILKRLNGNIHIIIGNHDTDNRIELYKQLNNVKSVTYASKVKYDGYKFLLTHMPCLTGSLEKELIKQTTINLSGHTHSKKKFFYDLPYVYNVALDAHYCKPVHIDTIIQDIFVKINECKEFL